MGKGGFNYAELALQEFSWDEIKRHNEKTDRWIVIEGAVYDVTRWSQKHPGGERIISHYAGQDATVCMNIFLCHKKIRHMFKFLIEVY